jgi:hypothetical protein
LFHIPSDFKMIQLVLLRLPSLRTKPVHS